MLDCHIDEKDKTVEFEHFVNYCISRKYIPDAYDEDPLFHTKIHTGYGGDCGLDGVLVIVITSSVRC